MFFTLALLPLAVAWNCGPGSAFLKSTQHNCRTQLWDVPTIDYSNNITAGWSYLNTTSKTEFYNGLDENRTYSHHPLMLYVDNTVVLIHSSAKQDEDSMGQEIWGGVSHDGGFTWTNSTVILPSALLPNQTNEYNFTYWCQQDIPQRAWGPVSVIQSPVTQTVYAVADSSDFFCLDGKYQDAYTRGAGRIARPMNLTTGTPSGPPCWLYTNEFTYGPLEFQNTVYGTEWGMEYCDEIDVLNQVLGYPANVPAWSAVLYNNKFYASDGVHDLQEVTHAVWDTPDYYFQRFWRDISATSINTNAVWTECTCNYTQWYPDNVPLDGNTVTNDTHPIYQTDITDARTKQFFGYFSLPSNNKIRYLASNPRNNTAGDRFPLTLAWQGYDDDDSDWTFKHIGVVATSPNPVSVPDSRGAKNKGFSYPSVVQVEDNLIVAYSENKQNIWISVIPISSLQS